MITTQEKIKILKEVNQSKIEYFRTVLYSTSYDDYEGFIRNFLEDTKYLFSFCSEKKYHKLCRRYEVQNSMFEPYE